jgi:hypothetical protein
VYTEAARIKEIDDSLKVISASRISLPIRTAQESHDPMTCAPAIVRSMKTKVFDASRLLKTPATSYVASTASHWDRKVAVGACVGATVGRTENEGASVGRVVSEGRRIVGAREGAGVGGIEGSTVGSRLGEGVGLEVGDRVGRYDGVSVGSAVGATVGVSDGALLGWVVGEEVGDKVGGVLGAEVGA